MGSRICVLSAGELQQIDTPFNLYHNPRNLFVAGFIGSPSMNFFDAVLQQDGGRVVVDTGLFNLEVPAKMAEMYKDHLGQKVVFGIRPEDIHDVDFQPPGIIPAVVEANIDVVEQMGNEMVVYLEEQGSSFISRMDPRTRARVGHRQGVVFNLENMHLFDVDNKLSLAYEFKLDEAAQAR
jgi:multiple sugar transport system ATP-binding protein